MKFHCERRPAFIPEQAFVVHLGLEAGEDTGRMVGRVEHVVSRKRARFQSLDELVSFMTEVLRGIKETTCQTC
jgi:hypothetical protein